MVYNFRSYFTYHNIAHEIVVKFVLEIVGEFQHMQLCTKTLRIHTKNLLGIFCLSKLPRHLSNESRVNFCSFSKKYIHIIYP